MTGVEKVFMGRTGCHIGLSAGADPELSSHSLPSGAQAEGGPQLEKAGTLAPEARRAL